jgi:hypothetical protein
MKTYPARLPRIYSLIDLTHFFQATKTLFTGTGIEIVAVLIMNKLCLTAQPRPPLKFRFCLIKE